jgi:hypothetical protein
MQTARGKTSQARIAGPERPDILLESESPYRSRRLVVEYDGTTTAAYLHDESGPIAATWVANHRAAPDAPDLDLLREGYAPEMPAPHTKRPEGSPPLNRHSLRALWLEEGDGAALLSGDELLAVMPGWSDMATGMPGYSRDVIGQTPFGWSLDDASEGLGPRVNRAADFWHWRSDPASWAAFQQGMLGHLLSRLGPGARYWDISSGRQPFVGVSERPATAWRPYTVLSTIGMGCQRMPVIQHSDAALSSARIELAVATTLPSNEAARIFLWLAQYPWREIRWLGHGLTIGWYHEPGTFPLGGGNEAVLFITDPKVLIGPDVPDMSGFGCRGEAVKWLWIIPITNRQRLLFEQRGAASMINQMAAERRSWVIG